MISCKELIEKSTIDSYYEFLFVLALGVECGRREEVLDLRGMLISDKGMLSRDDIKYMHYLKGQGYIFDGSMPTDDDREIDPTGLDYYIDPNCITDLYDVLVEDVGSASKYGSENPLYANVGNCYAWSSAYARSVYGTDFSMKLVSKPKMGNTLLHIMAHLLVCFYTGDRACKPVKFILQSLEASTMSRYLVLYACKTLKPLEKNMEFIIDENYMSTIGDMDLITLYNASWHAGRYKKWTGPEKNKVFSKFGFKEGLILALYTRERITDANPAGKITASSIVRIDSISVGKIGNILSVTQFSLNKTIEERLEEYLAIDDEYKHIYADLKTPKISSMKSTIPIIDIGIGPYFYDEDKLLLPLESSETISKLVTIDGKKVSVEMSEVDAIYWILNQYEVDFDRDAYIDYYNGGKDLLWDTVDGTPNMNVD